MATADSDLFITVYPPDGRLANAIGLSSAERIARNEAGRRRGSGCCGRCRDTWDWKQSHSTRYSDTSWCFPLCEECWLELATPEARWPFYEALAYQWRIEGDTEPSADMFRVAVFKGL